MLRHDLWRDHPQVNIIDFEQFTLSAFNRCKNGNNIIMTIDAGEDMDGVTAEENFILGFHLGGRLVAGDTKTYAGIRKIVLPSSFCGKGKVTLTPPGSSAPRRGSGVEPARAV